MHYGILQEKLAGTIKHNYPGTHSFLKPEVDRALPSLHQPQQRVRWRLSRSDIETRPGWAGNSVFREAGKREIVCVFP